MKRKYKVSCTEKEFLKMKTEEAIDILERDTAIRAYDYEALFDLLNDCLQTGSLEESKGIVDAMSNVDSVVLFDTLEDFRLMNYLCPDDAENIATFYDLEFAKEGDEEEKRYKAVLKLYAKDQSDFGNGALLDIIATWYFKAKNKKEALEKAFKEEIFERSNIDDERRFYLKLDVILIDANVGEDNLVDSVEL